MIGAAVVARARADGYTLLITGGMSLFPIFSKDVPFDPARDFTPIAMTHSVPFFLAVRREVPVQDFAALVAYSKANPGRLNYGLGSASYEKLYFEMLRQRAGLDMTEVLYKGGAPLYQALVVNEVQVALGALGLISAPALGAAGVAAGSA
jgi:tripartite-type tricarboxylate transporter receptor subunit TctC